MTYNTDSLRSDGNTLHKLYFGTIIRSIKISHSILNLIRVLRRVF